MDRCRRFPKDVRYTLSQRICELAITVQEGIIEAIYAKDRRTIIQQMNMSLEKLRVFFRISYDRRYISGKQHKFIAVQINLCGRMLGGWGKS